VNVVSEAVATNYYFLTVRSYSLFRLT